MMNQDETYVKIKERLERAIKHIEKIKNNKKDLNLTECEQNLRDTIQILNESINIREEVINF